MDTVEKPKRGMPGLAIHTEERIESGGVPAIHVKGVITTADEPAQVVPFRKVPRLGTSWTGVRKEANVGHDGYLDHAMLTEKRQPDLEAQLDGEPCERMPCLKESW